MRYIDDRACRWTLDWTSGAYSMADIARKESVKESTVRNAVFGVLRRVDMDDVARPVNHSLELAQVVALRIRDARRYTRLDTPEHFYFHERDSK